MKNMNINILLFVVIMMTMVATGCGKDNPVSATSTNPTSSVTGTTVTTTEPTTEPVITTEPTATPTVTVDVGMPTPIRPHETEFTFSGNFEFPEEDEQAFALLEANHIIPFLDGRYIYQKIVSRTGNDVGGVSDYEFVYVCNEDEYHRVVMIFTAMRGSYFVEKVGDEIVYDQVCIQEKEEDEWIDVKVYRNVKGLTGHME